MFATIVSVAILDQIRKPLARLRAAPYTPIKNGGRREPETRSVGDRVLAPRLRRRAACRDEQPQSIADNGHNTSANSILSLVSVDVAASDADFDALLHSRLGGNKSLTEVRLAIFNAS